MLGIGSSSTDQQSASGTTSTGVSHELGGHPISELPAGMSQRSEVAGNPIFEAPGHLVEIHEVEGSLVPRPDGVEGCVLPDDA